MELSMQALTMILMSTLLAGLAMPLGAALAAIERIESQWLQEEFRHGVMAFGGGALLSAVALVLVPEGVKHLDPVIASVCFIAGGLGFMALDILLQKMATSASQLAAMLSDFIPESVALGAAFTVANNNAFLLAGLIALQNIPEGFNAYREINQSASYRPMTVIALFSLMALLGPIAGAAGYFWLSNHEMIVGGIMLFASGGIFYSIFQDIAPQVKLEKHWAPPMGAIFGFVVGMVGFMLTT